MKNPNDWLLYGMRISIFPKEEPNLSKIYNEWGYVFDNNNVEITQKPANKIVKCTGVFNNEPFIIQANKEKYDFIFPDQAPSIDEEYTYGKYFKITSKYFEPLKNKILEKKNLSITRLAYGATGIAEINNEEHAVEVLTDYLGRYLKIKQPTTDFLYRINRPIQSDQIPDLKINRLTTWQRARISGGLFKLIDAGLVQIPAKMTEIIFCRLDINTDQNHNESFSRASLSNIIEELYKNANEILTNGDI